MDLVYSELIELIVYSERNVYQHQTLMPYIKHFPIINGFFLILLSTFQSVSW